MNANQHQKIGVRWLNVIGDVHEIQDTTEPEGRRSDFLSFSVPEVNVDGPQAKSKANYK